jgi:leucyl aminopeptidase
MFEPVITTAPNAVPVHCLSAASLDGYLEANPAAGGLAAFSGFKAGAGQALAIPGADGGIERLLFGLGAEGADPMALRALPAKLNAGDYRLEGETIDGEAAALAFWLGSYRYDRYRSGEQPPRPRLVAPAGIDLKRVRDVAHACALARDMINTPANDMGPLQIERIAREIAQEHDAEVQVWTAG